MAGMDLVQLLASAAVDPVPEPEDVRAGWGAFWLFMGLIAATALLMWSMVRQLRKTQANAERGVFGTVDGPGQRRVRLSEEVAEEQPEGEPRVDRGDAPRG